MSAWQPISTAPEGHGWVIVFAPEFQHVDMGKRAKDQYGHDCWQVGGRVGVHVTHWQPLPEPPADGE